jgi:hypothetical protein
MEKRDPTTGYGRERGHSLLEKRDTDAHETQLG